MVRDNIYKNISAFENSKSYFLFISAIFMALIHLMSVLLSFGPGYHNTQITENIFYYARFIAFFNISIPCISAMNYFITYNKNINNPAFKWNYLKFLIKLFFVLCLLEVSLEFFMNLPKFSLDVYSFSVLQFTGISLVLLHVIVNYLGLIHLIFAGLFSLIIAPYGLWFFRSKELYFLSGSNNYEFQWPLFPWFVIPVFGFILSFIWVLKPNYKKIIFIISILLFLALFYWTRSRINIQLNTRWGDAIYQPHTLIVIQNLLFIPILLYVSEKWSYIRLIRRYDSVDLLSRGILFFYVIHIFLTEVLIEKNADQIYIGTSLAEKTNLPALLISFLFLFGLIMYLSLRATKICLKLFVDYKISRAQ